MALKRVWIPSPNYSSRGGADVRLIVVHTAEGALTIESLGSWFQNPSAGCSSQTGADDKANTVGEYVKRPDKAWTQANFNPVATSIELCGFASWSTAEWDKHPNMLANCAAWIAEEAAHFGIPITRLTAAQAQGSGRGVCQHVDLGAGGGGHWDCGSGFPMDRVLDMARGGSTGSTTPLPEPPEGTVSLAVTTMSDGRAHVFAWSDKTNEPVYHAYEAKGGGWAGAEKGKQNAEWYSLGAPAK
jgi:hypothetical protein